MPATTISRIALRATLQWLRLPISALEALTGHRDNDSWPPAIAFGAFEAGVKQVVGTVLRDEGLLQEGRLRQAEIGELRRAVELEVEADQLRSAADTALQAQRGRTGEERQQAEQEAQRRRHAIDDDKRLAEQRVKQATQVKAVTVQKAATQRARRVAATERQARLTRVDKTSTALRQKGRAANATAAAGKATVALQKKKAQRKTG